MRIRVLALGLTAWLATCGSAHAQMGGSGSFGGGSSGGSSAGGGRGGSTGSGSAGQVGSGASQPTTISGESLLGSFNNVGTGSGRSNSAISTSNLFSTTYVNPYQQGLLVANGQTFTPASSAGFGQAVWGNISTGGGSSSRSSFGSTGANTGAGRTGSTFGGTSTGGTATFGSTGGGSTGFGTSGGGAPSFGGGSASIRSGSNMTYTGGSFGAAIGRTGPTVGATLVFAPATQPSAERRTDLQSIVARSSSISAPAGVNVVMDSGVVVLRGTVANSDEKRLVENMIRLQPGVHDLRNELEVRGGNP